MFSPTGAGQSIAIVDKSGKVVSTSKHILNLLKEARAAYQERKAEILAARGSTSRNAPAPRIRRAQTVSDIGSIASSRRSDRTRHTYRDVRNSERHRDHSPDKERRRSEGHKHDDSQARPKVSRSRTAHSEIGSMISSSVQTPMTPLPPYSAKDPRLSFGLPESKEEPRRASLDAMSLRRAKSTEAIDMDLAYGEPPPNLMMTARGVDNTELNGLVGKASFLLDEAKCVQHSVKSIITSLQKNPEAMAAVALTLGEISTLVKRMSPGALAGVRTTAPAVFALLTSPQFLIAAGVGVGVTVIALGGYKIIKKIQARREEEESPEQMIALTSEVNRIENWRQGVADIELQSVGTSVDGEIITPMAARLSKLNLAEEQATRRKRSTRSVSSAGSKTVKTSRSRASKESGSRDPAGTKNGSVVKHRQSSLDKDKEAKPKPKPFPLRSLFKP